MVMGKSHPSATGTGRGEAAGCEFIAAGDSLVAGMAAPSTDKASTAGVAAAALAPGEVSVPDRSSCRTGRGRSVGKDRGAARLFPDHQPTRPTGLAQQGRCQAKPR
jgi:hypothetical protein